MMIQSISLYLMADRMKLNHPFDEAIQNFNTLLDWLQNGIQAKGSEANA